MRRVDRAATVPAGTHSPASARMPAILLVVAAVLAGCGGSPAADRPDANVEGDGTLEAPERTPGADVMIGELALDVSWSELAEGWVPVAGAQADESGIVRVERYAGWLHVTAHLTDDGRIRQVGLFGEDASRVGELLIEAQHVADTLGGQGCWEDLERSLEPADLGPGEVTNGRCGEVVFTLAALPDAVAFSAAGDPGLRPAN